MDSILTKQPTSKKYPVPVPRGNKGPPTSGFVTKGAEAPKLPKGALAADKGALATIKRKAASAGVTKATRPAASLHKEKVSGKALYKPTNKFTLARTGRPVHSHLAPTIIKPKPPPPLSLICLFQRRLSQTETIVWS